MKKNNYKKRSSFMIAMLLVVSILFGSVGNVQTAHAATENYYLKINKGTNVVTVYTKDDKP